MNGGLILHCTIISVKERVKKSLPSQQMPHQTHYNRTMYIIAIGWLYVALLMAATESSLTAGILTFVVYGAAPLALLLWLLGTPQRRRDQLPHEIVDHAVTQKDGRNTGTDQ